MTRKSFRYKARGKFRRRRTHGTLTEKLGTRNEADEVFSCHSSPYLILPLRVRSSFNANLPSSSFGALPCHL